MNTLLRKLPYLMVVLCISCGPSESERLELEKKAADSVAAANAMMDAAKEAARVRAEERQREIIDSLARTTDSTKIIADTAATKAEPKAKP